MSAPSVWEKSFADLGKDVASVKAAGGYDFSNILAKHTRKDSSILDFGCGLGKMVVKLRNDGFVNVVGTDPSEYLFKKIPEQDRVRIKLMDGKTTPFGDSEFDCVIATGVFHHIEWDELNDSVQEISRILKPGGVFIYAEPRNTLLRKLSHFVVLSPFAQIIPKLRILASCLRAEWPTYSVWLQRSKREFHEICKRGSLEPLEVENRLLTTVVTLQNLK